ncbi:MAG: hypothetical protein ACLRNW_01650 [Neglectibacter sp.]
MKLRFIGEDGSMGLKTAKPMTPAFIFEGSSFGWNGRSGVS